MNEFKQAKEWIIGAITASEQLSIHPCLVGHICITADASNAATALIYDGESTSGKLKLALHCLAKTHFGDDFIIPMYFSKGLYIALGGGVTLFTIQYKEEV